MNSKIQVPTKKKNDSKHHDQKKKVQDNFLKDVNALRDVIEEMGNPFAEQNDELVILDTKEVVENEVADEVLELTVLGQAQYYQFIQEQLVAKNKSIDEPIKRNKITLVKKLMGASKAKK